MAKIHYQLPTAPPQWRALTKKSNVMQLFCLDDHGRLALVRPNEPALEVTEKSVLIDRIIKAQPPMYFGTRGFNPVFIKGYAHIPTISYIFDCIQNRVPSRPSLDELPFCLRDINTPITLDMVTAFHGTLQALGIHNSFINTDIYWWLLQYAKQPLPVRDFSMIAYRCHLDGPLVQHMMGNQALLATHHKLPDIIKIVEWCFEAGLLNQMHRTGLEVAAKVAVERGRRSEEAKHRQGRRHGGAPAKERRKQAREAHNWPSLAQS